MGVGVHCEGRIVTITIFGDLEGRDAVAWADEVRPMVAHGGHVRIMVELLPTVRVPIAQLAAGCRAALSLAQAIDAWAFVATPGPERSLARTAVALVAPLCPVAYFDDAADARAWLRVQASAA